MQKPRLLGVVNKNKWAQEGITSFSTIKELTQNVPQIGVILAHSDSNNEINNILTEIRENDQYLPFRLLVVRNNEAQENKKDQWTNARDNHDIQWMKKRFCVVSDRALWNELSSKPDNVKWEDVVIDTYLAWLKAFKPCPKHSDTSVPWKLVIGFERDTLSIAKKWQTQLDKLYNNTAFTEYAHVYIVCSPKTPEKEKHEKKIFCLNEEKNQFLVASTSAESGVAIKELSNCNSSNAGTYIVFDNHQKAFQPPIPPHFYAEIGSVANIELYQTLETPPPEGLSFNWFICSLIESSLLNIAVFDERLANSLITGSNYIKKIRNKRLHNKQRIFPLFSLHKQNHESILIPDSAANSYNNCFKEEGIRLTQTTCYVTPDGLSTLEKVTPDIVVFHLGLMEQSRLIEKKDHEKLRMMAQGVFVTTGRGGAREMPRFPLVDYASIHSSLNNGLNKLLLCQTLLSATAEKNRNGGFYGK